MHFTLFLIIINHSPSYTLCKQLIITAEQPLLILGATSAVGHVLKHLSILQ
jgi:NADPH:quinone reductase-like Zn-dependent oxidoreductase